MKIFIRQVEDWIAISIVLIAVTIMTLVGSLITCIICKPAFAASISIGGGLIETPSSTRGNAGTLIARIEQAVIENDLGILAIGGEYQYHGRVNFYAEEPSISYGDLSGHSVLGEIF